ncbi:MAG: hypothetical protein NUV97_01335 [archaeon]|nr:hypothetical protein [archaeon]MCR4323394.1 hypothetical protein [Nanoarchaeota archaeon]
MKRGLAFIGLFIVVFLSLVVSAESREISQFSTYYNDNIAGTSSVDRIFGNQRIDVYLDEELSYHLITSEGKIIEEGNGGVEKPSLNIYVGSGVLNELMEGTLDFQEALATGGIEYRGVGFISNIKFRILHFFQNLFVKPKAPKNEINDLGSECGNNKCEAGENPKNCYNDCCGTCGDGKCKGYSCGEDNPLSEKYCPKQTGGDCGNICGDGTCDKGENPQECPADCDWIKCGDGICSPGEDDSLSDKYCPKQTGGDCGNICGDGTCDNGENFRECPGDCKIVMGFD